MSSPSPGINLFFNHSISSGIFYNLLDSDLKTFGQTSKKMNEVVKKELEARDEKFKELLAPFLVTRHYNILAPKLPSKLLVADGHGNPLCTKARSKLIGYLSRRARVIFLAEGAPSMSPCSNFFKAYSGDDYGAAIKRAPHLQSFPDELILKENISFVGWDLPKEFHDEMHNLKREICDRLKKRALLVKRFVTKTMEMCSQLPEELQTPLKDRLVKEEGSYRALAKLFLTQVTAYIQNNSEELGANNKDLLLAHSDYTSLYDRLRSRDLTLKAEILEIKKKKFTQILSQHDNRTASMVSSLRAVDSMCSKLKMHDYFTVVSAGCNHLEFFPHLCGHGHPKVGPDLSSLYEELENHSALILVPLCLLGADISEDDFNQIFDPLWSELVSCIEEGLGSSSDQVQKIIKRHHIAIEQLDFESSTKTEYIAMAEATVENPGARELTDPFHPQLATFMAEAMKVFAERHLS